MRLVFASICVVAGLASLNADAVHAQSAPAAPKASAPTAPSRQCTRLPLSDIQVGREETIASARKKLVEEYAPAVFKERGWTGGFVISNETATCEDYLYLPFIGQEYRCLVTATFCRK